MAVATFLLPKQYNGNHYDNDVSDFTRSSLTRIIYLYLLCLLPLHQRAVKYIKPEVKIATSQEKV